MTSLCSWTFKRRIFYYLQIEGRCSLSALCDLLSCGEARERIFSRSPQQFSLIRNWFRVDALSLFVDVCGRFEKMTIKSNYSDEYCFCNGWKASLLVP
ncbi:hypothetical protein HAX54_032955 [Datura stramonium]|uniref:Uncharacterized protein n=1 Tax=Datura stramonium TaxID=4076 RepID=A0ABS8VBH6_DATST|nr:hypothetical protein [Datura stramonium]